MLYPDELQALSARRLHPKINVRGPKEAVLLLGNSIFKVENLKLGRGRGIRTPDPLLPKQMRYQTALYPDMFNNT